MFIFRVNMHYEHVFLSKWCFFLFYVLVFKIFLCCWRLVCVCIFLVKVTEWPPIGKIAAHSAYEMFSWYKYLIVSLVFSHLGFWSGSLFLIAPFPDLCLLVLFFNKKIAVKMK